MPVAIALLILRVIVGLLFIGHGTQKLFGWFGGHGRQGTGGFLDQLGYRPGSVMAVVGGASETVGGFLLASGFLTPFGAAAIIGMMASATLSVHLPKGLWNSQGGYEFPLTLAAVAAAVAFAGPGRFSIDHLIGWQLAGVAYGLLAVAVGLASAIVLNTWRLRALRQTTAAKREPEDTPGRAA